MVAGFLVMFMQAGFALVETGPTRAKNVAHTMGMNFLVYAIGIIGFFFIGFALQMGGVGAVFGEPFILSNEFAITLFGKLRASPMKARAAAGFAEPTAALGARNVRALRCSRNGILVLGSRECAAVVSIERLRPS